MPPRRLQASGLSPPTRAVPSPGNLPRSPPDRHRNPPRPSGIPHPAMPVCPVQAPGLSPRQAERLIKAAGQRAGILKRVSPTVLRHTYALRRVMAGDNIRAKGRIALLTCHPPTNAVAWVPIGGVWWVQGWTQASRRRPAEAPRLPARPVTSDMGVYRTDVRRRIHDHKKAHCSDKRPRWAVHGRKCCRHRLTQRTSRVPAFG